ncbi:MAG: ABC transporter permease [Desulfopila sp.]|jgi:ABC-2 type transport system permease protein|nr:ABC transporter permease [Desulfopila sp.]
MMSPPSLASLLAEEWRTVRYDPWLFSLISWLPPLLFLLMWAILSAGIIRELPIGMCDLDKSNMSRSLTRHYQASPTLQIRRDFTDPHTGTAALRAGEIYALIVLPADLEKDTVSGRPPQITAFVNTQFLVIGKVINSSLMQAHSTFAATIEMGKNLLGGAQLLEIALIEAVPARTQVTPLFNSNSNYAQFLVSAILPAVWQILMVVATILSLAAEKRRKPDISSPLGLFPVHTLLTKLGFLSLIFWLHGLFFLLLMYVHLGWPMHGSWVFLMIAQFITVCAGIAVASMLYFLTMDGGRALSFAAAYTAPALAFMGVTFPVSDMTLPARIWRSFIPISHYAEIQFGQVNYGAPPASAIPQLVFLCLFLPALLFSIYRVKRSSTETADGQRTI